MIRLLTLGPPALQGSNGPLAFPPALFGLLAYIAVAPPGVCLRRDALLSVFWPELDEQHARNALSQAVFQIRHRLGREAIQSRGKHEVVLGMEPHVDALLFQELLEAGEHERALELYRGDFLEGLHLRRAPEFERWSDGMRARLREAARAAAEAAGERCLADDPRAAGAFYRRALEVVPVSEAAARGLMHALARQDDAAGAVRAYRQFARRLRRDYGLRPSAETTALAKRIRSGETSPVAVLAPATATTGVAVPPGRRMTLQRSVALDLVARSRELHQRSRFQHETALGLLEEAVRVDEGCAEAHAALSADLAYSVQVFGGPRRDLLRGIEEGNRAIRLAPHLPEAHFALGVNLETAGRLSPAGSSLRRASRLAPADTVSAAHVGRVMLWSGRFADAVRATHHLLPGRPDDAEVALQLGLSYGCLDMHQEAEEWLGRALALQPGYHWVEGVWSYFDTVHGRIDRARERAAAMLWREPDNFLALFGDGHAALFAGDRATALARFERVHELDPESRETGTHRQTRTVLGHLALEMGERASAAELLAQAESRNLRDLANGADFGGPFVDLAAIHALRGERDAALGWLERSFHAGWRQPEYLRRDPLFAGLRREERFRAVLTAMDDDLARQRAGLGRTRPHP
jgi:DNA-binding SARP family transcriptional activator/tetratricopeptide (TPR) repeat protein